MVSNSQVLDGDGTDWTAGVRNIGARTDNAGSAVVDLAHDEDRLINHLLTEGFLDPSGAFAPADGASGMQVDLGSGTAKADLYVVEGDTVGQHPYLVRMDDATVTMTLDAGDADPRIDEIWLVVYDNTYDSSGRSLARLVVRKGDADATPSAPGPDAAWEAAAKLATIDVAASASTVSSGDITDERTPASLAVPNLLGSTEVDGATEVGSAVLTGSLSDVATVSLTIPSGWGGYKIVADASYVVDSQDPSNVDVVVTIGGTAQQQQDFSRASNTETPGGIGGRRTGMTTTGSVDVTVRAAADAACDLRDVYLYARAVRTS